MKKTTKAQRNMDIIAILKGEPVQFGTTVKEAIAHLEYENELLSKKKSGERKPTARQTENEGFKAVIFDWLTAQTEPKTVTDMMKSIPELDGMTNQRVSALVKQLKDVEVVDKTIIKGRSYFFVKQ